MALLTKGRPCGIINIHEGTDWAKWKKIYIQRQKDIKKDKKNPALVAYKETGWDALFWKYVEHEYIKVACKFKSYLS